MGDRSRGKEKAPSGGDPSREGKGTSPGQREDEAYPEKLIPAGRNGFRRRREDVFCRWEKGGDLSRMPGAQIRNSVIKRPLPGPVDSVGSGTGDRTATKPVFPADTEKTGLHKERIILSLFHKFPRGRANAMEMFALLFTLFLPNGYKMATFLFFLYKNASLPGHKCQF